MEYTSHKVDDQNLMFHIAMMHKDKEISFNVVCAESEDEIEGLIQTHLDFLDNPPVISPAPQSNTRSLVEQQAEMIAALEARITAIENGA
jgi:hypothetical protein